MCRDKHSQLLLLLPHIHTAHQPGLEADRPLAPYRRDALALGALFLFQIALS